MTSAERQQVINDLVDRLSEKLQQYHELLTRDKQFEEKKKLLLEIKKLQETIEKLKAQ